LAVPPDPDPRLIEVLNRLLIEFENDAITSDEFREKIGTMTEAELRILTRLLVERWRERQQNSRATRGGG